MKKTILFIIFFLLIFSISSQSRWDLTLNAPFYMFYGDVEHEYSSIPDEFFLLGDVRWNYFWGEETLKFGPGLRLWTFVIESVLYPVFSVESNLGNFVINGEVGGGAFLMFGIYNDVFVSPILVSDLTVGYKLGKKKILRLGAGVNLISALGPDLDGNIFGGRIFVKSAF